MSVDACITGSSSQVFTFTIGNMRAIGVSEAFCETKINNKHAVLSGITTANQEIVWLDVSMNYSLFVAFLNSFDLFY
jgi:hypothetical protein